MPLLVAARRRLLEGCGVAQPSLTTTTNTTTTNTTITAGYSMPLGMDKASRALVEGVPPGVPFSFRALADHREVPHSTAHHRSQGRRSLEEKAQDQQYLTP
jgi:hypothetical protein